MFQQSQENKESFENAWTELGNNVKPIFTAADGLPEAARIPILVSLINLFFAFLRVSKTLQRKVISALAAQAGLIVQPVGVVIQRNNTPFPPQPSKKKGERKERSSTSTKKKKTDPLSAEEREELRQKSKGDKNLYLTWANEERKKRRAIAQASKDSRGEKRNVSSSSSTAMKDS